MRRKQILNSRCDYVSEAGLISYSDERIVGNRGLIYGIFREYDPETNFHYIDYWNTRYVTDYVNLPKPFGGKS